MTFMRFRNEALLLIICVAAGAAMGLGWLFWPEPTYQGRPVRKWVREALGVEPSVQASNACYLVTSQIQGPAVPYIVRELRKTRYPKVYWKLCDFQTRLPRKLRLLPQPKRTDGMIQGAGCILEEMGDPGRPGFSEVARCVQQSRIPNWEYLQVMWELIQMGPAASSALPQLRQMAAGPDTHHAVLAALAVYNTDRTTNALALAFRRLLAQSDSFGSISWELNWFRGDDHLLNVLLPLIRPLLADETRDDRIQMIWYLGECATTSDLARETLEALARSTDDSELAEAAREALKPSESADDTRKLDEPPPNHSN